MAKEEASEKRFQLIMEKLFNSSKRTSSSSEVQLGVKRMKTTPTALSELNMKREIVKESTFGSSLVSSECQTSPACRPWDRGDLMKRLATFKSMKWFGKPKAVSPIKCACRGWVNAEVDVIACEACGARLVFSTPSSWTRQQVEKTASVFSLKLDSGHKLHCPWINNSCEERLALFPPTPVPTLVEGYRERCTALLQLLALPVISSSALDYMKCPELENFLAQSPHLPYASSEIIPSGPSSGSKDLVNNSESISADLYYQALKLVSLCGWEAKMLSYAVDCEEQPIQRAQGTDSSAASPRFVMGLSDGNAVYSSIISDDFESEKAGSLAHGEVQCDPASVVLNCRLCGAYVGLWTFSTVPRPLEFFRMIKPTEIIGTDDSCSTDASVAGQDIPNIDSGKENLDSSQGVFSTFSNDSALSRQSPSRLNLTIAGGPPPTKLNFRTIISLPIVTRRLIAELSSISNLRNHKSSQLSTSQQENIPSDTCPEDSSRDKNDHMEIIHTMRCGGSENVELNRNVHESELNFCRDENLVAHSIQNTEVNEVENAAETEKPGDISHMEPSNHLEVLSVGDSSHEKDKHMELLSEYTEDAVVSASSKPLTDLKAQECLVKTSKNKGNIDGHDGNDLKLAKWNEKLKFDPVRHHRHFCPWINSGDSTSICGWKLTLSALEHQRESSHDPPSTSVTFQDDDPVASVRKLFMSPSEIKKRSARGSS